MSAEHSPKASIHPTNSDAIDLTFTAEQQEKTHHKLQGRWVLIPTANGLRPSLRLRQSGRHDKSRPYTSRLKGKVWAIVALFVVGTTLGTALDPIDMYSQVTHYTIPWWLPPTFGVAAVAMGYVQPMLASLLGHVPSARRLWIGFAELAWLVLAYLVGGSSLASIVKVALLLLIFLAFWWLAGRSWQSLLLSIITGLTGTLVEMILVAIGLYSFVHPNIFGVPYWLPGIYAVASLAVGNLGSSLLHFFQRIAYNQAGNIVVDAEEG